FLSVANSETGAILNYEECADIAQKYNVPLILDAVQTLGKMELKIHPGISAMSFSAHKVHGPKGVGLVFLKHGKTIAPLFLGGYQQEGMRAGTENLAGILGFAKAIELIDRNDLITMQNHISFIEERLKIANKEMKIHGGKNRIANTSNVYFPNTSGENLLIMLEQKGVIISLGSACASGSLQPSTALLAMGLSREEASNSLRISLSRMTTKEEVEKAVSIIEKHVCQ
ncbi:MAG: aminotransferase class V-fold PLP-dependent enzyme, partial [Chlamydiae bacterium]|nr:aminotransferase class V-fold PLP-dependent enzyme [Chlamydiota bacterium]